MRSSQKKRLTLVGVLSLSATVGCLLIFTAMQCKVREEDVLIKIRLPSISLPAPDETDQSNLIFLETSTRTAIRAREGCAIESAALHNPQRTVILYSLYPASIEDAIMVALRAISNVKLQVLDGDALFANTPLQVWHEKNRIQESNYPFQHLSDASRIAILWKHGGIYLDTDMISIRKLDKITNVLAYGMGNAANSVIAFQKQHPFLLKCMEDYATNFTGCSYDHNGPLLTTRVLKKVCFVHNLGDVINRPEMCQGITLLPDHTFYAFPWTEAKRLFEDAQQMDVTSSYTVHLYAKITADMTGTPGDGSFFDVLSKTNCPVMYQQMVSQGAF